LFKIKDLQSKKVKQILILYSSMIIGIVLGVVVSVFNTRFLGVEAFGDFKFIQSVYSFFAIIISFGYVVTASKILAEKKNDSIRKELMGTSIIITCLLGFIFIVVMLLFSVVQKNFFTTDLSALLLILSPLFFFVPFAQSIENILQGENRIFELAVYRLVPQILYVAGIIFLYEKGYVNLKNVIFMQMITLGLATIALIYFLKPKFSNFRKMFELIAIENKEYGVHVYLGSIIGVASTQLGPIAISFFSSDNISVGYFSLALTITMPLVLIPTVVGTSMFKEFANMDRMPAKATKATIIISLISLLIFLLTVKPLIILLYSKEYLNAVDLSYIVALGQILHGFGNYYNRFLGSKGQGVFLRNGAISVGIANVLGFILIVPFIGAYGAAVTKLVSGIVYIASMLIYYKKYTNVLEKT